VATPVTKVVRSVGIDAGVPWRATCFRRVVDGKVVEGWGTYDWLGVHQQLGATPPPG
jgi:hypothetical protein